MAPSDLTDEEWAIIVKVLPAEGKRRARPSVNRRGFLNGMLFVLNNGCAWRDLPERYGKWNSVYTRYLRWGRQGVWDILLPAFVKFGVTEDWKRMSSRPNPGRNMGNVQSRLTELLLAQAEVLREQGDVETTIQQALPARQPQNFSFYRGEL